MIFLGLRIGTCPVRCHASFELHCSNLAWANLVGNVAFFSIHLEDPRTATNTEVHLYSLETSSLALNLVYRGQMWSESVKDKYVQSALKKALTRQFLKNRRRYQAA